MTAPEVPASPEATSDEGTLRLIAHIRRMSRMSNLLNPSIALPESYKETLTEAARVLSEHATELQKARAEGEARAVESWTVGSGSEITALRAKLAAEQKFRANGVAYFEAHADRDTEVGRWWLNAIQRVFGQSATRPQEPPTVPERMGDGLLALACGIVWAASTAAWRAEHLPACAICLGNFGYEPPTGEQT